jgi:predicted RND superfamily exporter protein
MIQNNNNNTHRTSSAFIKGTTYRADRTSEISPQKRQAQVKHELQGQVSQAPSKREEIDPSINQNNAAAKEKLLITGDDVLIEYVARLMIAVKSIKENMLRPIWKN